MSVRFVERDRARSVSTVIPVYNGERYLAEAIESVLVQTYPAEEIIVVDDGSTDASVAVAGRFAPAVTCERMSHSGPGAARNRGVALARGGLLAFLDADDRWEPDKLARQVDALAADPELEAVFGHVRQFHSPELDADARQRTRIRAELLPGYHPGTMLIRREAFLRVGFFETHSRVGEFVNWHARAADCGLRMLMLPDVVMHRRLHESNLGIRERQSATDYVRHLKATLDRRRAAEAEGANGDPTA